MVKDTPLKTKGKRKRATGVEPKPEHLAACKFYFTNGGFGESCKAEIAIQEFAFRKYESGKIRFCKIGIFKGTTFVLAFDQGMFGKVLFSEYTARKKPTHYS